MSVRARLTRLALTGVAAGLLASAPALAEQASIVPDGVEVNGFSTVQRPPLPGERATGNFPGASLGGAQFGFGGEVAAPESDGVEAGVTLRAMPGDGPIYSRDDTRLSRLLGDGVAVYENPIRSGYFGYNPRSGGYDRWNGSLSYNQAYLRHLYDGNLAGTPSVGAPIDFWRGTR